MTSVCPVHGKTLKEGKFGEYCPTKLQDGSWCRYKPGRDQSSPARLPQESLPAPPVVAEYASPPAAPVPPAAPGRQSKPEPDWEAKDRLISSQAAYKDACSLYQGGGRDSEFEMHQCAAILYKIMMGCKIGGDIDLLVESIANVGKRPKVDEEVTF